MGTGPHLHVQLRRAVRELEKLEARMLERSGARLRPGAVPLLAALLDESPLSATELCGRCEVEPSTLTGVLRTLEANGLVQRAKVVLDQRRQAITLTPRGRSAARVALRARMRAEEALLAGLAPPVVDALRDGLVGSIATAARTAAPAAPGRRMTR